MVLTFEHTFVDHRYCTTYFSFCYPFSYTDCQKKFDQLEQQYNSLGINQKTAQPDEIYFHRELLIRSLDGRRVDCLTVTSCRGITMKREDRLDGLFPYKDCPRPFKFKDKKVRHSDEVYLSVCLPFSHFHFSVRLSVCLSFWQH
jgi:hypothetical protein